MEGDGKRQLTHKQIVMVRKGFYTPNGQNGSKISHLLPTNGSGEREREVGRVGWGGVMGKRMKVGGSFILAILLISLNEKIEE